MGTSEYSYRGVFDREKEVSWGIRKQLHLYLLVAKRTQVTEIRVFPKAAWPYCRTWCMNDVSHFSGFLFFQPMLVPAQTTLSWHSLPTLLISNTVLPYNHTAIAPCQPHHSSASCTSMFSLSLSHALSTSAQPLAEGFVFCTVSNLSTSPQTPVTLSVTSPKGNQKFHWSICLASGYFCRLDGQVIWFIFH